MFSNIAPLIQAVLTLVNNALDRFFPDPAQAEEAKKAIAEIIAANESSLANAARDVMIADSNVGDPYVSRARPTIVYWSIGSVTLIAGLASFGYDGPVLSALSRIPEHMWNIMSIAIGGYMFARTAEKTINTWVGKNGNGSRGE